MASRLTAVEQAVVLAQDVFQEINSVVPIVGVSFDAPSRSALRDVEDALRAIRVAAIALQNARNRTERPSEQAEAAADLLQDGVRNFLQVFRAFVGVEASERLRDRLTPVIDRYDEHLEARQLVAEVRETRDEANRVLSDTRRAAGATGETSLAKHFGEFARREQFQANLLRVACILTLLAIAGVAALLLTNKGADITTSREIGKLATTIPMAVLATYLGGESTRHRRVARRAREMEIQLQTVDAFTHPLPDELRDRLRTELGHNVFARVQVARSDEDGGGPSVVNDAGMLIEKIADLLKSVAANRPGA